MKLVESEAERQLYTDEKQIRQTLPGANLGHNHSCERITSESIERAFDNFIIFTRAARLTAKTQSFYHTQLVPFVKYCRGQGIHNIDAVSPSLIRSYLIGQEDRGLSDYSIHAAARAVRAFLNFCVREGYLIVSPMTNVAMPRVSKRILPAFDEDDITKLLSACSTKRDRAIILFLLDTGCRLSELVNLDGSDVDLTNGEVHIRQGKGRTDRTVFIGYAARDGILDYYQERSRPGDHEPVWLSSARPQRLTASGVQQLLRRLGRDADVEHCSPHTFRRTFAIWSLRNGMDIFRLARLMGHRDISVLRQYLYLLKDDLRAAHAQFGSVDRFLHR